MAVRADTARFQRTQRRMHEQNAVATRRQSDAILDQMEGESIPPRIRQMKQTFDESRIAIEALRIQRLHANAAIRDIGRSVYEHAVEGNSVMTASIETIESQVVRPDQRTRILRALAEAQENMLDALLDGQQDSGLQINTVAGRSPIPPDSPAYRQARGLERFTADIWVKNGQ